MNNNTRPGKDRITVTPQPANADSVSGNLDDRQLRFHGIETHLYRNSREIGQILFIVAAVAVFFAGKAAIRVLREMTFADVLSAVQKLSAYVAGVLAMSWTLDRVAGFWI